MNRKFLVLPALVVAGVCLVGSGAAAHSGDELSYQTTRHKISATCPISPPNFLRH